MPYAFLVLQRCDGKLLALRISGFVDLWLSFFLLFVAALTCHPPALLWAGTCPSAAISPAFFLPPFAPIWPLGLALVLLLLLPLLHCGGYCCLPLFMPVLLLDCTIRGHLADWAGACFSCSSSCCLLLLLA